MLKEHRVEILQAWLLVTTPTLISALGKSLDLSEPLSYLMGIRSFTNLSTYTGTYLSSNSIFIKCTGFRVLGTPR